MASLSFFVHSLEDNLTKVTVKFAVHYGDAKVDFVSDIDKEADKTNEKYYEEAILIQRPRILQWKQSLETLLAMQNMPFSASQDWKGASLTIRGVTARDRTVEIAADILYKSNPFTHKFVINTVEILDVDLSLRLDSLFGIIHNMYVSTFFPGVDPPSAIVEEITEVSLPNFDLTM